MISHRKEVLAILCGADEQRQAPFTLRQRRLLTACVRTIGLLLAHSTGLRQSRRLNQQLKPASKIDQITGLPNLQAWRKIIEIEEAALMLRAEDALVAIAEVQEPQQDSILSLSESDKRALRDAAL